VISLMASCAAMPPITDATTCSSHAPILHSIGSKAAAAGQQSNESRQQAICGMITARRT
jgi:hypothetical protein